MKSTETEWKMKICLLTLYLNQCNESKLMFRRKFLVFFSFFFFLRHSRVNLRTSTYILYKSTAPAKIKSAAFSTFHKNLRSAAGKFAYSAVCGNTHAPPPSEMVQQIFSVSHKKDNIHNLHKFFLNASVLDNKVLT